MTDPRYRWWLLFGLWLLYTGFGLIATSLAPLVAQVEHDLGMSHAAMGSVMGAWQLVYIFSAVPCGVLLDRLGARRALLIGAALIAASSIGRGFAEDYLQLLLAVMLFGLGGPIVSAGAPKVVAEYFSGSSRGFAMGIYMTGPAIGGVISLTATHSLLLPGFDGDWRWVFWLWGGFSLGAGVLWWLIARRLKHEGSEPATTAPASQREVMGTLLREPAVRLVLLMAVGVFLFNHGLNNWLPELLRQTGMTAVTAGYWAALPTVVGIFGSLLIPRLATPERRYPILLALCAAAGLASVLLHFTEPATLVPALLLQGIARSSLMTVLVLILVELPGVGDRHAGTASGLFFSAAEVGGVLGPLGLGALLDLTGSFDTGLAALTVVAAGLMLATLRVRAAQAPAR